MPRVATTSTLRPRKAPVSGKRPPYPPREFQCSSVGCPWSYTRPFDLKRHMNTHLSPEEKHLKIFKCDVPGCRFETLQKSNLETHINARHTGEKPHVCPCGQFRTADPSTLYKHMRDVHQYKAYSAPRRKSRSPSVLSPWSFPSTDMESFESPSPPHFSMDMGIDVDNLPLDAFADYFPPSLSPSSATSSWESWLDDLICLPPQSPTPTPDVDAPATLYPAAEQAVFTPEFVDASYAGWWPSPPSSSLSELEPEPPYMYESLPWTMGPSHPCAPTPEEEFQVEWDGVYASA